MAGIAVEPRTIDQRPAVRDVIDLYDRVNVGTTVNVL
jgi:hypothetical protein